MTREVFSVQEDDDFVSADQIMRLQHLRHLPVLRDGKPVGLIRHRDLMKAQMKLLSELAKLEPGEQRFVRVPVAEIMHDGFLTCDPASSAGEGARMMRDAKAGAVLVVDADGTLVGILTATDVMSWAIEMGSANAGG